MTISFRCHQCHAEIVCGEQAGTTVICPYCSHTTALHATEAMQERNTVDHCAICDCPSVYMQKDFNRAFGISLFLLAAAVSCWFYFYNKVWLAFAVLLGAAAVDYLLYRLLPDVIVCYKCHSQYRDFAVNKKYAHFELALAEKHDPKDRRIGEESPAANWKQR